MEYRNHETELHARAYLRDPASLVKPEMIRRYDENAADAIARCEAMIEELRTYRIALAARYGELEIMPHSRKLLLKRYIEYGGKKAYYIHLITTYSDGTESKDDLRRFDGKERAAALKEFEALRTQYPDAQAIKDIERKSWEK